MWDDEVDVFGCVHLELVVFVDEVLYVVGLYVGCVDDYVCVHCEFVVGLFVVHVYVGYVFVFV